jgi:D-amino-acid dehydrogenase
MRESGVEFEEHRAGILVVARDRAGLHWFEKVFDELVPLGFPGDLLHLSGDEARQLERALGAAVGRATRTTIDRHVAPESLVAGPPRTRARARCSRARGGCGAALRARGRCLVARGRRG